MAAALPFALAGISAGGSLASGIFGAKSDKTQAAQMEYQAGQYRLRANQVAHSRREAFGTAMGTVRNLRASRNIKSDSRSSFLRDDVARRRENNNENSAVLGEKLKEQQLLSGAAAKRRAAPFKLLQGGVKAIGAFAPLAG